MERFGLIGYPLKHSFSPKIHKRLGSWPYELHPLQPEELGPFLQAGEFSGLNVTLPYKTAVIPYCTEHWQRQYAPSPPGRHALRP